MLAGSRKDNDKKNDVFIGSDERFESTIKSTKRSRSLKSFLQSWLPKASKHLTEF